MVNDVFVSYASKDKHIADAIVAALEARRVYCWIAPRDVPAGSEWAASIIDAISAGRAMIVVLSRSGFTTWDNAGTCTFARDVASSARWRNEFPAS